MEVSDEEEQKEDRRKIIVVFDFVGHIFMTRLRESRKDGQVVRSQIAIVVECVCQISSTMTPTTFVMITNWPQLDSGSVLSLRARHS